MVTFVGKPYDLPKGWSRGFSAYGPANAPSPVRPMHVSGYEDVPLAPSNLNTPDDVVAGIGGCGIPSLPLGVFLGNWVIAFLQRGHWEHIVDGRPEVVLEGLGRVDVVGMAEHLREGNLNGFRAVTAYP